MTDKDKVFVIYGKDDNPDPNCFCHFGWEGVGSFALWKYACAYYDSAEILFQKFGESKGDFAVLDGIGLTICFSYRHFIELALKHLFVKFACSTEQEYKDYLEKGHNLYELWMVVKPKLKELKNRVGSTVDLGCLEHYIKEFHKFDESSMTLRYPINKDLKPSRPETKLDIINLHERMSEFYTAIDALSYELDNQLYGKVPEEKIKAFDEVYERLHERVIKVLEKLKAIKTTPFNIEDIFDRNKRNSASDTITILEACSGDELILLDTLYYTGRAIRSEELRLPKNPYEARADAKTMCVLNMMRDNLEFGKPANDQINIWGKQNVVLVDCIQKSLEVIDFRGNKDQASPSDDEKA